MNKNFKNYLIFWGSQSLSQLGSSMTSFALIIWAFEETNSTMGVSLLTFFSYLPYILISLFSGVFVDKYNKKNILIYSDLFTFLCTTSIFVLLYSGKLNINFIYIVNFLTGVMNSFQAPASSVVNGLLVPKEMYSRVSGMKSFSSSLITIVTPMFSAFIISFWGLEGVILFDAITFIFAFIYLIFFLQVPICKSNSNEKKSLIRGSIEGFIFIGNNTGLLNLILSISLMNFLSRLTYENIFPTMILLRSNGCKAVLGVVSAFVGIGGVIGGIIVSVKKFKTNKVKLIYYSAAMSFLLGDTLMALGNDVYMWIIAGFFASVPIPFIDAGLNVIMYEQIPKEMQGRVFYVRNALQFFTIPVGLILGGALAEYVFEPLMKSDFLVIKYFQKIVGQGPGSGMALMFLITGILGLTSCLVCYKNSYIRNLDTEKQFDFADFFRK